MDVDDALVLARSLMRQHRLRGWIVEINARLRYANARARAGHRFVWSDGRPLPRHVLPGNRRGRPMLFDTRNRCWLPYRSVFTQSVIQLSRSYVERSTRRTVQETILHEIAHALAPSNEPAHGPTWKAIARRIGANPNWLHEQKHPKSKRQKITRSREGEQ